MQHIIFSFRYNYFLIFHIAPQINYSDLFWIINHNWPKNTGVDHSFKMLKTLDESNVKLFISSSEDVILHRILSFLRTFRFLQISHSANESSWTRQYIEGFCPGWLEGKRKRYWSGLTWPQQPISRWIEVNGLSWHVKARHGLAFRATRPSTPFILAAPMSVLRLKNKLVQRKLKKSVYFVSIF